MSEILPFASSFVPVETAGPSIALMWHGLAIGDWAGWAQVVVVAATGFAAVFVADRQLTAFNNNERFRNSIKVIDDFRTPAELFGQKVAPMDAAFEIQFVASTPTAVHKYKMIFERANYNGLPASDVEWFKKTHALSSIVVNYYLDLGDLLDRNIVDNGYVMSKIAAFFPPTYAALLKIGYPDTGGGLKKLAAACEEAYGKSEGHKWE